MTDNMMECVSTPYGEATPMQQTHQISEEKPRAHWRYARRWLQEERDRIAAVKAEPRRSRAESLPLWARQRAGRVPRYSAPQSRPAVASDRAAPVDTTPPVDGNNAVDGNTADLLPATDQEINVAISVVYDAAEQAGQKPPNIAELREPVHEVLKRIGRCASGNKIIKLAQAGQHAGRRWERGGRQGKTMPRGTS